MTDAHFGFCEWTPGTTFSAHTPYGSIDMFGEDGHRAVELMLLSAAACLNFFLVEYAQARDLPVERLAVRCDGEIAQRPERVDQIHTRVTIEGSLSDDDANKMVQVCERACKVMNTFRMPPGCAITVENNVSGAEA